VVRAKELLCQVLHRLRGGERGDPGAEAEEAALRAELRHEEARRGEALREVRALIRQVAGEAKRRGRGGGGAGQGDEAQLVAVAPKHEQEEEEQEGQAGEEEARRHRRAGREGRRRRGGATTGEAASSTALQPPKDVRRSAWRRRWGTRALRSEGEEEEAEDKDDCPVCLQPLGAGGGGGGGRAHHVRARVPRDVPGRVGVHVREEEAGRDVPVVQGAGQQVALRYT
jgi:hypothetical protein